MRMQKMGAGPIPGMQPQATPPGMPPAGYPPARPPQPTGAPAAPGLNLDMNALNSLLGAIQGGGAQRPPAGPYGAPAPGQAYGAQQQHDIGSLLSAIGGQARPPAQPVAYPAQSGYGPPQAYPSAAPQAYPSAGTAYPSAPPAQQTYYGQQQQQPPAVGGYGASPPQRGGYGGGARGGGAYRGR